MTTGEKIKTLRKKKMMTQSALVGKEITRNMLSRIENGQANPSLDTLIYLSKRLDVPVGYLLASEKEDAEYEKGFLIEQIHLAYQMKNYRIAKQLALEFGEENNEISLIAAESAFRVAVEEFDEGRLHSACAALDEAIMLAGKTVYYTKHIVAAAALYFEYMRSLTPNLYSNIIDEDTIEPYCAMDLDFCRYAYALVGVDNGHTTFANSFIESSSSDSAIALHLSARIDIVNSNFRSARAKLSQILVNKSEVCRPVLYSVLADIEVASRELNDFKSAYEYSTEKIWLLERMLSDE